VARVYVIHNTFWTDQASPNAIDGGGQSASSGASPEAFYLRNNLFRMTRTAFDAPTVAGRWDEDYNYFGTTAATRGLRFGTYYTSDVAAYRAASKQGAHTNLAGDFVTPPTLNNPSAGDLSLPTGSLLVDAGLPAPNISDRASIDYTGSAPDLGARER
jgi:D-serine deaminase-like pyridoxal phosphate-dependent protein